MLLKSLMLSTVLFLVAIPALAQSDYPKAEVFGGYSYLSRDIFFDDPFDDDDAGFFNQREGLHGFGFSIAGNFHRNIGIVGDFSYHKKEFELPGDDFDISNFVFLFGPRLTARGDKVDGFVHTLVGGVRNKFEGFDSDSDFALGLGGGVDIKLTDSFAVRAVQLDYIPIRARNPFTLDKEWNHNLRVQVGVTFKLQ